MRFHWKPILTLLVIAPVLTELLSGNLPPSVFFHPVIFLYLATVAYGFPVLLLREIACRKGMGIPGMLCLGLAYGIINEGILAKTFYLVHNVPINLFDSYGLVWGIEVPWAIVISVWHAFHAFVYPVLLAYYFFPETSDQPWLTPKSMMWLAVPTILICTLVFFTRSKEREPGLLLHFIIMLATMSLLYLLAVRLPRIARIEDKRTFSWKAFLCGAGAFLLLFFVPLILARVKVPSTLFCAYWLLAVVLGYRWFSNHEMLAISPLVLFATGDNMMLTLFSTVGTVAHGMPVPRLAANLLFLAVFSLLIIRLRREARASEVPPPVPAGS